MTLTPFVSRNRVAWSLMKLHPRHRKGETACKTLSDHAVLLGFGRAGARLMQYFLEHNIKMVVVDDDAAVIRQLIRKGIPCIQGDGSDIRSLELAHGRQARVVICSMRRTRDAKEALKYLKDSPAKVLVRAFEPEDIELIEAGGGYPVRTVSVCEFSEWLDLNLPKSRTKESGGWRQPPSGNFLSSCRTTPFILSRRFTSEALRGEPHSR